MLEAQGWRLCSLPKSKRDRRAARYDIAQQEPKIVFDRSAKLSAPYMKCLLTAADLMARNADIMFIYHGEPDRHYLALLAGHDPSAPLDPDDMEAGAYVFPAERSAKRSRVSSGVRDADENLQQGLLPYRASNQHGKQPSKSRACACSPRLVCVSVLCCLQACLSACLLVVFSCLLSCLSVGTL